MSPIHKTKITPTIFILMVIFLICSNQMNAQKPPLNHSVYDNWKSINGLRTHNNSDLIYYNIIPQQGDNALVLYNAKTKKQSTYQRLSNFSISENGEKLVALIKPFYNQIRQAKIDKKKSDEMPKDTLVIIDIKTNDIKKIALYKSHSVPLKLNNFFAYQLNMPKEEKKDAKGASKKADTLSRDSSKVDVKLAKKESKTTKAKDEKLLYIMNLHNNLVDTLKYVDKYSFDPRGNYLSYIVKPIEKDTITKYGLYLYNLRTKQITEVITAHKDAKIRLPEFNEQGTMAFYANTDTSKAEKKNINIYLYNIAKQELTLMASNASKGLKEGLVISENTKLNFSKDGKRLFLGIAPIPLEKDTTLVEFEQPQLDIWSWDADYNQPMQLLNRERDLKQTYTAYINTCKPMEIIQLGDKTNPRIYVPKDKTADWTIVQDNSKYRIQTQWNIGELYDLYLLNVKDGSKKLIEQKCEISWSNFSPDANYVPGYNYKDSCWYVLDIINATMKNVSKNIKAKFYDDENDMPVKAGNYGAAMWLEDNSAFLIPDKYDYWKVDPKGKIAAENFTEFVGRNNKTTLVLNDVIRDTSLFGSNAIKLDQAVFFSSLNRITKETGLYTKDIRNKKAKIAKLVEGPYTYKNFVVSLSKKPTYIFTKGNFEIANNVYLSSDNFKTQNQLSDINPQQKEYNWGTVELFNWTTEDKIAAQGLLFKPEDFDSSKKYPVMIYFYEKYSNDLFAPRSPAPSRSTVNIPYFVSNGYIVFIPDIYYFDGHPGKSAMRSIMPAVEKLEKDYPWIDAKNMAIQGQSWGGYQVAYMITQTDKFKAAGAGAPVANMTSAYGGIRWGSGMTRQFQYEQTQSRIGKDLWKGFDLYIENSPLFFLPNVTTPVLIMHNDKDGAVPWYQGIELFTGLRRLGKVAWLLQYNNEDHNLVERKNAKDLSIRLSQFFDHYLKGAPMPSWMKNGRPAVEKGFSLGY